MFCYFASLQTNHYYDDAYCISAIKIELKKNHNYLSGVSKLEFSQASFYVTRKQSFTNVTIAVFTYTVAKRKDEGVNFAIKVVTILHTI